VLNFTIAKKKDIYYPREGDRESRGRVRGGSSLSGGEVQELLGQGEKKVKNTAKR